MARYVTPIPDFTKYFDFHFKTKEEADEFEENGAIWNHNPFLEYIENFEDDKYGYNVSRRITFDFIGKGRSYSYCLSIFKFGESYTTKED